MAARSLSHVALLSLVALAVGCQPARPTVNFSDIALTGFQGRSVDLDLAWDVSNPNPVGLSLAGLDYDLNIEQVQLLSGASSEALSVPAMGANTIHTPARIDLANIARLATSANDDWLDYQLNSTLTFDVLGNQVPVSVSPSGRIARLQAPRLSLSDVRLGRDDAGNATLELDLNVENPNVFDLPSAVLNGALKYGSTTLASLDDRPTPAIAANGSETVTVAVRGGGLSLLNAARQAVGGSGGSLSLDGAMQLAEPVSILRQMIQPD